MDVKANGEPPGPGSPQQVDAEDEVLRTYKPCLKALRNVRRGNFRCITPSQRPLAVCILSGLIMRSEGTMYRWEARAVSVRYNQNNHRHAVASIRSSSVKWTYFCVVL